MMEDSRSMAKLKRQLMHNGAGEEYSNKKVDLLNNRQYLKVGKKCHEFRSQNDSLMPQDHYIFFMIYEVNQFHCPSRGNKHGKEQASGISTELCQSHQMKFCVK